MKHVLSFIRRLAPYESIWLILMKVMILNPIKWSVLLDLIKNPNQADKNSVFAWWRRGDISISRLEELLQVESGELQRSLSANFLEDVPLHSGQRIRHCSICIKNKYHSSIFTLPVLSKCPWHGTQLMYCESCTGLLRRLKGAASFHQLTRASDTVCSHLSFLLTGLPVCDLNNPDLVLACEWHKLFESWLSSAVELLGSDVYQALNQPEFEGHNQFLVFRFLEAKIGMQEGFASNVHFPVRRIIIPQHKLSWMLHPPYAHRDVKRFYERQFIFQKNISRDDQIAMIKSLRRFVWMRYIRPHKRCLNALLKMGAYQGVRIVTDERCSAVLAYACWLVQLYDDLSMSEALSSSPKKYRYIKESLFSPRAIVEVKINRLLTHFYDLWGAIEEFPAIDKSTTVLVSYPTPFSLVGYKNNLSFEAKPTVVSDSEWGRDYGVYVVEPTDLEAKNNARCLCGASSKGTSSSVNAFPIGERHVYNASVIFEFPAVIYNGRRIRYIYV